MAAGGGCRRASRADQSNDPPFVSVPPFLLLKLFFVIFVIFVVQYRETGFNPSRKRRGVT